ncbi:BlaI family transcriptional regulator [Alteromonas macleodii]|uniref:BlaI family transcriptional regulator n=2 Tax=Alteromonas macleodii TaxID=28108 RepID=A0A6T9Y281_ALTMA|nr:BlaI family transcriptional regulator [Alteromonas macleodii]
MGTMSKMSDKPEISNAEFEVLDVLWDDHPATSSEVVSRLNDKKDWHEKTVKTLLGRLIKKEVLGFEKQQRQYLYYPLIAREDYTRKETTNFVSRLFKGKIAPMVAGFANQNSLSKQDVNELKALIKEWEENND